MAFKNITVSEEAYDALKRLQKQSESFSKVILRVTGRGKLKVKDVAGILSAKEAEEWEAGLGKVRSEARVKKWQ